MSLRRVAILSIAAACSVPPVSRRVVAICDRSTPVSCEQPAVRELAASFMASAPPPASSLEILVPGCTTNDVTSVLKVTVPSTWGPGVQARRKQWRGEVDKIVAGVQLPVPKPCSAIAEAVWVAAARLREGSDAAQQLVVISDGRQVSAVANFERRVPDAGSFVASLREQGVMADLRGVPVEFCNVHDRSFPKAPAWTPRRAQGLRLAWIAALGEMGAGPVRISQACHFDQETR